MRKVILFLVVLTVFELIPARVMAKKAAPDDKNDNQNNNSNTGTSCVSNSLSITNGVVNEDGGSEKKK